MKEAKKKTVVGGYTILERRQVGEVMIAVGHHPTAPAPYGTWKAYEHSNFQSFNHGNYFSTEQKAMGTIFSGSRRHGKTMCLPKISRPGPRNTARTSLRPDNFLEAGAKLRPHDKLASI